MLKKYAEPLEKIEQRFGVPGPVLVAIRGLETSVGEPEDGIGDLVSSGGEPQEGVSDHGGIDLQLDRIFVVAEELAELEVRPL